MNNSYKLEELRDLNNLTKKKLADKLGVSDSIYSRWENNNSALPTRRLVQIANYYKLNIDYILGLTKTKITIDQSRRLNLQTISNRLRTVRSEQKLSLREFASVLNTTSSTISAYETGKVLILESFLEEICRKYKYSADWILGFADKKRLN